MLTLFFSKGWIEESMVENLEMWIFRGAMLEIVCLADWFGS